MAGGRDRRAAGSAGRNHSPDAALSGHVTGEGFRHGGDRFSPVVTEHRRGSARMIAGHLQRRDIGAGRCLRGRKVDCADRDSECLDAIAQVPQLLALRVEGPGDKGCLADPLRIGDLEDFPAVLIRRRMASVDHFVAQAGGRKVPAVRHLRDGLDGAGRGRGTVSFPAGDDIDVGQTGSRRFRRRSSRRRQAPDHPRHDVRPPGDAAGDPGRRRARLPPASG